MPPIDANVIADFEYGGFPVQVTPGRQREVEGCRLEIGEPLLIAARDDSPDEGYFVTPDVWKIGSRIYVNWAFDWDVPDRAYPDRPHGRFSDDGGLTWQKQTTWMPPGNKFMTGEGETTCYFACFEMPDAGGRFLVPTWRSGDEGRSWQAEPDTRIDYPGARGFDLYDPPQRFREGDRHAQRGEIKQAPPDYLQPYFQRLSRRRPLIAGGSPYGRGVYPQVVGPDGTIFSMTYGRYLPEAEHNTYTDEQYWQAVDMNHFAALLHQSTDQGRTWDYVQMVAHGRDYEGEVDFSPGDGFSEPALAVYPDGEMVCVMRSGHFKPLYLTRSHDVGRTWSQPECLSIRGIYPSLIRLADDVLVLSTGRPDCTLHVSMDRGRSWPVSETLYVVGKNGPGQLQQPGSVADRYASSHCNNRIVRIDSQRILYVHDATRADPQGQNRWLRRHGHGLILGRIIRIHKD